MQHRHTAGRVDLVNGAESLRSAREGGSVKVAVAAWITGDSGVAPCGPSKVTKTLKLCANTVEVPAHKAITRTKILETKWRSNAMEFSRERPRGQWDCRIRFDSLERGVPKAILFVQKLLSDRARRQMRNVLVSKPVLRDNLLQSAPKS